MWIKLKRSLPVVARAGFLIHLRHPSPSPLSEQHTQICKQSYQDVSATLTKLIVCKYCWLLVTSVDRPNSKVGRDVSRNRCLPTEPRPVVYNRTHDGRLASVMKPGFHGSQRGIAHQRVVANTVGNSVSTGNSVFFICLGCWPLCHSFLFQKIISVWLGC